MDAASPEAHRQRLLEIATSPGLAPASVDIPVSTDAAQHSVLAAASQSLAEAQEWVGSQPKSVEAVEFI